jgi:hypothetical protein
MKEGVGKADQQQKHKQAAAGSAYTAKKRQERHVN